MKEYAYVMGASIVVAVLTAMLSISAYNGKPARIDEPVPTATPVPTPSPVVVSVSTISEVSALRATTKKVIDEANDIYSESSKKEIEEAIKDLDEGAVMMAKGGKNFTLTHVRTEQMAKMLKDLYEKKGFKVDTDKWLPDNYLVKISW